MISLTQGQIKKLLLDPEYTTGKDLSLWCTRSNGKWRLILSCGIAGGDIVISSHRSDVREFKSLDAAHNVAVTILSGMTVI